MHVKKVIVVMLAAGLVSLTAMLPARASSRTETQPYVGVIGNWTALCDAAGQNFGGACFPVRGTDAEVTVSIHDMAEATAHLGIGGFLVFFNVTGDVLKSGEFCGSTVRAVPPNATLVRITVDEVPSLVCPGTVPATSGTITTEFHETNQQS